MMWVKEFLFVALRSKLHVEVLLSAETLYPWEHGEIGYSCRL